MSNVELSPETADHALVDALVNSDGKMRAASAEYERLKKRLTELQARVDEAHKIAQAACMAAFDVRSFLIASGKAHVVQAAEPFIANTRAVYGTAGE